MNPVFLLSSMSEATSNDDTSAHVDLRGGCAPKYMCHEEEISYIRRMSRRSCSCGWLIRDRIIRRIGSATLLHSSFIHCLFETFRLMPCPKKYTDIQFTLVV